MTEEKTDLFRQEALEAKRKRQIEELMVVVTPKGWLALITFCSIVFGIIVWSWVGRIPAESIGTSIIINQSSNARVNTLFEGKVAQVFVTHGQNVAKGQLLALIDNPNVDLELSNLAFQKMTLAQQMENYTSYTNAKNEAEMKAIEESTSSSEWEIFRLQSEKEYLEKDLTWKKELMAQGLLALPQINESIQKINQTENAINREKTKILENETKIKELNDILQTQKYQNDLEEINTKTKAAELKKEQLQIKSPIDGTVISIPITLGTEVEKGQMIGWIEPQGEKDHVIYGYFTSIRDQQIKPGMYGHVKLNSVDSKKYGSLVVKVEQVWSYPISSDEIYHIIGNRQIVNTLTNNGENAPVQILCKPVLDPKTQSGFKWTSKNGPPNKIDTGSMGDMRIIVEEKRPIEFVFPFFRSIKNSVGSDGCL